MNPPSYPLLLLIFANDRTAYLDSIRKERQHLISLLQPAADALGLELKDIDYSTVEGVIDLLNLQRERLAVLHFAGHSGTNLLRLDEGDAHASGLAAKLAECPNLKLVFLNGCNNAALVKAIADAGIPSVIGTRQPIADDAAKHFSQGFFKALAEQKRSVAAAFAQAQADVQTLAGQHYRSLDLSLPAAMQEWAWFMASNTPDWQLADAANPCNRLPALPRGELPAKPFKNLYYYTAADAEIFFGRCRAILEVLQLLDEAKEPLLLLHGGTGVGKSSFLLAGLIPRLKAPSRQQPVHYLRYNELNPQQDPLAQLFGSSDSAAIRARLDTPTPTGLPAIWIIDQMEEIFFARERTQDAKTSIPPALDTLLTALHSVFYPPDGSGRPDAKLILSLRKEWFAELHDACRAHQVNQHDYLLKPLDKPAILEVIETPAATTHLYQHYHLRITNTADGRLAEQIADDLLTDKQSNIAPTLQIILSRLWERVEHQQERVWDEDLYLDEQRTGLLLEDYLDQQLQDIAAKASWGEEAKDSGLLLDVLHSHTTPQGTAKTVTAAAYETLYPHIPYRAALLKALKDRYLIIEPQTNENQPSKSQTRLAHDTLAQLVKTSFDASELPGQRMQRILSHRYTDWLNNHRQASFLDDYELEICEKGVVGKYRLTAEEESFIQASKKNNRVRNIMEEAMTVIVFIASFYISISFLTGHGVKLL
jgi:hypothetical protein